MDADIQPISATVNGTMPAWLNVERYGNGFGKFEGGDGKNAWKWNYLFDVTAYTLKWTVNGDDVTFVAKFTNSSYSEQGKSHIPEYRTFAGTTPDMTLEEKAKAAVSLLSDNFNVNIVNIGGKVLGISDMVGQVEFDPDTLATIGYFHFNDTVDKEKFATITCAHPSQLPEDIYVYNYVVNVDIRDPLHMYETQFFQIDTTVQPLARNVVWTDNDSHNPSYMHQFANTQNYLILFDYPLWWDVMGIAKSLHVLKNMQWNPSNGTRVRILDKRTWNVAKTYWTDAFFAYHQVNAYEDTAGDVIVDIMTVPCEGGEGMPASCLHMNAFNLDTLKTATFDIPRGDLRSFHLPIATGGDISYKIINKFGMDLYAIHPALKGKQHRFVWAMGNHGDASAQGVWWNSIIKIDMKTNVTLEWWKQDTYPSEVSFIPRPDAVDEDDGVLISTVLGVQEGRSYLLVLDARDLSLVATADAPEMLPFPSHGHSCAPVNGKRLCFWG